MLQTGLLSLNVHEPLTFDAEIVLHPDIFSSSSAGDSQVGGISTVGSTFSTTGGGGGGSSSVAASSAGGRLVGISLVPTASSEDKLTTATSSSQQNQSKLLQEGDLIEIRVWDSKSVGASTFSNQSNVTSVLRRRTSQATVPKSPSSNTMAASLPTTPDDETSAKDAMSHNTSSPRSWSDSKTKEHRLSVGDSSLQYSESTAVFPSLDASVPAGTSSEIAGQSDDDNYIPVAPSSSRDVDTSTVSSGEPSGTTQAEEQSAGTPQASPSSTSKSLVATSSGEDNKSPFPTKTVITAPSTATASELPPIFPRSRTSTMEAPVVSLPPKPPTLHRRTASTGAANPNTGASTLDAGGSTSPPKGSTRPAASSSVPRPRHFRDLSDMTIDTVFDRTSKGNQNSGITSVLDSTNQLDLNMPIASAAVAASNAVLGASTTMTSGTSEEDNRENDPRQDLLYQLASTHTERLSFVMLVSEKSLTSLKGSARTQVSILRPIADLYNLSSYDMVTISKVEKQDEEEVLKTCSADFISVSIKDQFVSRGEMQLFQRTLIGSWVYEGQRLSESSRGIQAYARELRHKDQHAFSGIITEQTKITFRSRSSRLIWLVQMSKEMWEYTSPYERDREESLCETYFDKWIAFVHRLFGKWKRMEVTHSLTVVFFSRTFIGSGPSALPLKEKKNRPLPSSRHKSDVYGRSYEDHFRIVVENFTGPDWDSCIVKLKQAFVEYPVSVGWNLSLDDDARRPSTANQGNVLEAINVTLNLLQYHYLDRDLHRTGNSIVLVSAGNGVFEVEKGLASITYERMMVNGIGSDMLSLSLPPLHTAPFFLYVNDFQTVESEGVDFGGTYFEVPHWMHLSFVSYDKEDTNLREPENDQRNTRPLSSVAFVDGRAIMANGFILHTSTMKEEGRPGTSPMLRSTPRHAVSPEKKHKQPTGGRQLIAGRDFNDILEACRPRNSRVLPSPLEAIIRMFKPPLIGTGKEKVDSEGPRGPELPEWGSLEFDAGVDSPTRHRRAVALGQEPAVDLSPGLEPMPSPFRVDEAEKASVASSYSSSCLGVSYDRPFLATRASPSLTGIQVQRSPSLDIDLVDDGDEDEASGLSDASTCNSAMDHGAESSVDSGSVGKRNKPSEKFLENVRALMKDYDSKLITVTSSPRLAAMSEPNHSRHSQGGILTEGHNSGLAPLSQQQQRPIAPAAGGLGAALSQYRKTSGSSVIPLDPASEGFLPVSRVASTSRLQGMGPPRLQLSEMGARGMSPLLLPPVTMARSEVPDFVYGGTSLRRSIENRLVHPDSVARIGSRGTPASLSRSPPSSGSPIQQAASPGLRRPVTRKDRRDTRRRSKSKPRRKKAFNPFRQEDEDEVLAKKSHNRRRWSHVFPLGEVEFKRHAGPNWKSLTSPAALPISVDYFPSQQELEHGFTEGFYHLNISEFENTNYSSNQELLMEMVRQRLTQDFQLVPPSNVNTSNFRRNSKGTVLGGTTITADSPGLLRKFLSMGPRLQVLTYDPAADVIEVTRYDAKSTRQTASSTNTFRYHYTCYCQLTGEYQKVVQTFSKYPEAYNWSKVDRIICGDEDREMREGMRFRRLMFGIIPDKFEDATKEQEYIAKFGRLLEYLNKLRDSADGSDPLDIKIVSREDMARSSTGPDESTPGIARNAMQRFYVRLRKGKGDSMEWMEVVVDNTFNTSWSYRIMFHWLVAGAKKVEAQVQLLQRRCTQFGLTLIQFPQISVTKDVFLNPFRAPAVFPILDPPQVELLDAELHQLDFLHDGVFYTDGRTVKECLREDIAEELDFGKRWSRPPAGRQFVHRSGTLFVRVINDMNGRAIVVCLGNTIYLSKDAKMSAVAERTFQAMVSRLKALPDKIKGLKTDE